MNREEVAPAPAAGGRGPSRAARGVDSPGPDAARPRRGSPFGRGSGRHRRRPGRTGRAHGEFRLLRPGRRTGGRAGSRHPPAGTARAARLGVRPRPSPRVQGRELSRPPALAAFLAVAALASEIATFLELPQSLREEAWLCGLVHDIGALALSTVAPEEYAELLQEFRVPQGIGRKSTSRDWNAAGSASTTPRWAASSCGSAGACPIPCPSWRPTTTTWPSPRTCQKASNEAPSTW